MSASFVPELHFLSKAKCFYYCSDNISEDFCVVCTGPQDLKCSRKPHARSMQSTASNIVYDTPILDCVAVDYCCTCQNERRSTSTTVLYAIVREQLSKSQMHGQNLRYKYATETLRDSEIRSILNEYVLVSTLLACVTCMMKIARTSYLKFVPYNPKPKSTKYNTPWRNSSSQLPVVSRSTRFYDNSCMTVYLRSSDWVDGNCLDYRLF